MMESTAFKMADQIIKLSKSGGRSPVNTSRPRSSHAAEQCPA